MPAISRPNLQMNRPSWQVEPTALIGDYSTVILDDEEFVPLFRQYRPQVFVDTLEVFPDRAAGGPQR